MKCSYNYQLIFTKQIIIGIYQRYMRRLQTVVPRNKIEMDYQTPPNLISELDFKQRDRDS